MGVCQTKAPSTSTHVPVPRTKAEKEATEMSKLLDKSMQSQNNMDHSDYVIFGSRGVGKSSWYRHMYGITTEPSMEWIANDPSHAVARVPYIEYSKQMIPLVRRHLVSITKAIHDSLINAGAAAILTTVIDDVTTNTSIDVMRVIPQLVDNGTVMPNPTTALAIQQWWSGSGNDVDIKQDTKSKYDSMDLLSTPIVSARQWWLRRTLLQSAQQSDFPCTDATDYFMKRFATIASSSYECNSTDIALCPLQLPDRSSHISVSQLSSYMIDIPAPLVRLTLSYASSGYDAPNATSELYGGDPSDTYIRYRYIDVHQYRSSRRQWIRAFGDSHVAPFFIASMSDYNEADPSGEYSSKMAADIALFNEIYSSRWFRHTKHIYVLLTKRDLFIHKFKNNYTNRPFSHYWPDYKGSVDGDTSDTAVDAAIEFISNQFHPKNRKENIIDEFSTVYHCNIHHCDLTDIDSVRQVQRALMETLLRNALSQSG